MDHQNSPLASITCPDSVEVPQNYHPQVHGTDTLIERECSRPIPYNQLCVEIPEVEDESFKAVRYNDLTMITRRINDGFDVNSPHKEEPGNKIYTINDRSQMVRALRLKEYTLLHVATIHSNLETIRLLLLHGADVNATDLNFLSPLALAAAVQRPDVVSLLLTHGANPNSQSLSGGSPLTRAILASNFQIVKQLVEAGADLDLVDTKGSNALFTVFAVPREWEQKHIVQALIDGGCTIDYENKQGATPLMMAAGLGKKDFVEMLLNAGADINHRDKSGKTAVHLATGVNTALFLINHGASADVEDNAGKRPVHRAAFVGHVGLLRLLLLSDCKRSLDLLDTPRVIQARAQVPAFDAWLNDEFSQPRSLRRLCRESIRSSLSPKHTAYIDCLPLPRILKDFLLVKHIDLSWLNTTWANIKF